VIRMLEGQIEDDSLFGIIFTLDEEDDWRDPKCWAKANPMLCVSVSYDYLENEVNKAQNEGSSKVVSVLTKNFNVWTDSAQTWISSDLWQEIALDRPDEELSQVPCWGGLDLSKSSELTAFVLVFACEDAYHFKYWFFTPEDRAREKNEDRATPYLKWIRDGHLLKNEGNEVDYNYVQQIIEQAAEQYNLQSIAFDRYNAAQLIQNLQDAGLNMSPFNQGIGNVSAPTKELERLIHQKQITHDVNACMDWQMSNVEIYTDANENIKITKKNKHKSRVDGPVASVMAFGEMLTNNQPTGPSIYEQDIGLL
jgi:phage terminase large subunit-like protein